MIVTYLILGNNIICYNNKRIINESKNQEVFWFWKVRINEDIFDYFVDGCNCSQFT